MAFGERTACVTVQIDITRTHGDGPLVFGNREMLQSYPGN